MDLNYTVGYDSLIGFKGILGTGMTFALCSNQKDKEIKDWRVCWINKASGGVMMEKAVYLEASSTLEVQKKLNDYLRIRTGPRMTAALVKDTECDKTFTSGGALTAVVAIDWDLTPSHTKAK